jgi:hypothetical protein
MRWIYTGRGALLGAVAGVLGCGGSEADSLFQPVAQLPSDAVPQPPAMPPPEPVDVAPPPVETTPPPVEQMPVPPAEEEEEGSRCKAALGVSGSPQTISEAIILLNTLPKPATLACFLEALDRPLTLYMTKSDDSLQPSPGARSPRTFVLRGDMEMSVVLDGSASNTLEFGFRPQLSRSIKAEVLFPVTRDVTESSLFDRVQLTPRTTKCGACHVAEDHVDYPGFPLGVYESDVLAPFDMDEVSIESMKAEAADCDADSEPYRCGLLSALFDHGEVVPGVLRGPE